MTIQFKLTLFQGHKRWDKAVVSGLENLRSLVHENFLPALERCVVILSRLRGLARFYDSREDIGFSVTKITKVMDIMSCLSLVGNKILVSVMDELEHFNSFSTWLRFQIDRFATSSDAEELTEKEATMDMSKILVYIERYLTDGSLSVYFDEMSKDDYASDWKLVDDGVGLLDLLTMQLKKHESGQKAMMALPRVEFLVDYATTSSEKIFEEIAVAKKRSVRFGQSIQLSTGQRIKSFDSRMCQLAEKVSPPSNTLGGAECLLNELQDAIVYIALAGHDTSSHGTSPPLASRECLLTFVIIFSLPSPH
jgi:anaphase-promoting complex subunit 4